MAAGSSPVGKDFAARHADISFVLGDSIPATVRAAAETKAIARQKYGRDLMVFTTTFIICAHTQAEARRLHALDEDFYFYQSRMTLFTTIETSL